MRHDPMIAGKDGDQRPVEGRHVLALPAGEPGDELFEPAEQLRGLGQLALTLLDGFDRGLRRLRHELEQCADIVESGALRDFLHLRLV